MIFFVVTEIEPHAMGDYLAREAGRPLSDRVKLGFYSDLARRTKLPAATYIFSDIDRLGIVEREVALELRDQLVRAGAGVRLLNDPRSVMLRYELLRTLHERGSNRFGVCRASDLRSDLRFPVFVRQENEHFGPLTPLLHDDGALRRYVSVLGLRGYRAEDLLVVEYLDTADEDGIYKVFRAFNVGGQVLPWKVRSSRNWLLKTTAKRWDTQQVEMERAYVEGNPHGAWIAEVFRHARIDFGRIDYGSVDGELQVWEINLNPTIGHDLHARIPRNDPAMLRVRRPTRELFNRRFHAALESLDSGADSGPEIDIRLDSRLLEHFETEKATQFAKLRLRRLIGRLPGAQFIYVRALPAVSGILARAWRTSG